MDVVPYLLWALVGIAFVLLLIFLGRIIRHLRRWAEDLRADLHGTRAEREEEQEAEGTFWYVAELLRLCLFVIIAFVGITLLQYLFSAPADTSIYTAVLGTWTVPMVALIVSYYALKTIPYVFRRPKTEEEGGT